MNDILARWNNSSFEAAAAQILPCCASKAWAREMASRRPFQDECALMASADEVWYKLNEPDWMEAFNSHPRIGGSSALNSSPNSSLNYLAHGPSSSAWAMQEQKEVAEAGDAVKIALAEGNRAYEAKFGRIFIVCATGKSALELLEILSRRLQNAPGTELREAAEQQRQIIQIRLRKWLQR
jgi:2-oxo-4-hydroxy-4-carboxy-5-ureidoimidazoline decarboxylase